MFVDLTQNAKQSDIGLASSLEEWGGGGGRGTRKRRKCESEWEDSWKERISHLQWVHTAADFHLCEAQFRLDGSEFCSDCGSWRRLAVPRRGDC